jgi:hypothetical protein
MQRWSLLIASTLLLGSLLGVMLRYHQKPEPQVLVPALTGEPEYCLTCHVELPEISPSHPIDSFGCVICHGGERLALDPELAHSTMRGKRNPSDLSVVEESCGGTDCHAGSPQEDRDHIQRVRTSIQATYAGAIASVRYTFGAQDDLQAHFGIFSVEDETPLSTNSLPKLNGFDPTNEKVSSIITFAENCLNCHLTAEPLDGAEYARLSGCAACHTVTAGRDLSQPLHQLTTAIPYTQCNTCHNRGNYDLKEMEFHARQDHPADRLQDYYQPIAQFTQCEWELDCIDCHTSQEAMGNGDLYSNQKQVEYVRCYTCHGTLSDPPLTRAITGSDELAMRRAFLNPVVDLQVGDTILVSEKGEPFWNIRQDEDGSFRMVTKITGKPLNLPLVQGSGCQQNPNEQESRDCHACHAIER